MPTTDDSVYFSQLRTNSLEHGVSATGKRRLLRRPISGMRAFLSDDSCLCAACADNDTLLSTGFSQKSCWPDSARRCALPDAVMDRADKFGSLARALTSAGLRVEASRLIQKVMNFAETEFNQLHATPSAEYGAF